MLLTFGSFLSKLRIALMKIAQTAWIAREEAHQVACPLLHRSEIMISVRYAYLISLLEILMKTKIL